MTYSSRKIDLCSHFDILFLASFALQREEVFGGIKIVVRRSPESCKLFLFMPHNKDGAVTVRLPLWFIDIFDLKNNNEVFWVTENTYGGGIIWRYLKKLNKGQGGAR